MNALSSSLHPLATLETINLVRTITLKRRSLICPALEFIFQGLESFVEYYSFFFSPLSWVDLHTSCDLGDVSLELVLWFSW